MRITLVVTAAGSSLVRGHSSGIPRAVGREGHSMVQVLENVEAKRQQVYGQTKQEHDQHWGARCAAISNAVNQERTRDLTNYCQVCVLT